MRELDEIDLDARGTRVEVGGPRFFCRHRFRYYVDDHNGPWTYRECEKCKKRIATRSPDFYGQIDKEWMLTGESSELPARRIEQAEGPPWVATER